MKISEITGQGLGPRGHIEFDSAERDTYVARFLAVFQDAELTETETCSKAYEIHLEIAHRHDLYIAVADKLGSRIKAALHWYSQCRGEFKPKPKYRVEE